MKENETSVLEQYDIELNNMHKVRGAILCESDRGVFLLKEVRFPEKRVEVLDRVHTYLLLAGFEQVDRIVRNKEQQLITLSEDGSRYLLKQWYYGRECDCRREHDLVESARTLARLHCIFNGSLDEKMDMDVNRGEDLRQEYERHNRELRKVRMFIRGRVDKGEFERMFLNHFEEMYCWADEANIRLSNSNYLDLLQKSRLGKTMIHGDYNYHNVLMTRNGVAVTNFDHVREDVQMADLYYFLRKTLEKNHWNVGLGDQILNAYGSERPLQDSELEYLQIRLSYPEKFWKVADTYCRFRKTWIPVKCKEKLELAILQMKEKQQFLQEMF